MSYVLALSEISRFCGHSVDSQQKHLFLSPFLLFLQTMTVESGSSPTVAHRGNTQEIQLLLKHWHA